MSKKIIKAHQKVVSDSMEEKKRFHLYKAGKLWLVAGMATFSFATAELTTQVVSADTVNSATPETSAKVATSSASGTVTLKAASSSTPSSVSAASSAATPASTASSAASSKASSAVSSAASSEASSSASSKATSSAASKTSSSEASSSASSKAAPSASSKASSAVSSTASKATSSVAVKAKTAAASTSTSSAASKDDVQADQKLNAQLKLGQVATVKQDGDQLILTIAKNQVLSQAQRDAIIDYAKKNQLSIEGLPKQTRANAQTAASNDLSLTLFDKNTTKKGGAHEGDTITSDGTTLTISQLTGSPQFHMLSVAEVNRIMDYVKTNNLKVVDTTNVVINEIWYTDGSVTVGEAHVDSNKKMVKAVRTVSDPVLGLLATTATELRNAKWMTPPSVKSGSDNEWSNAGTNGQGVKTGVYSSKQFQYAGPDGTATVTVGPDVGGFTTVVSWEDEDVSFDITLVDGTKITVYNTAGKNSITDGDLKLTQLTNDELRTLYVAGAYGVQSTASAGTYTISTTGTTHSTFKQLKNVTWSQLSTFSGVGIATI